MYTSSRQVKVPWRSDGCSWLMVLIEITLTVKAIWIKMFFFSFFFFVVAWIKLTVSHCQQKLLMSTIIDFYIIKEKFRCILFIHFFNFFFTTWVLFLEFWLPLFMILFYSLSESLRYREAVDVARHCQVVKYWIFFKTLQKLPHPHSLIDYRHISCSATSEGHTVYIQLI